MAVRKIYIKKPRDDDSTLSPREAMELYIDLELEHKEIGQKLKGRGKTKAMQASMRRKRKLIRTRQNMLYPTLVNTGYVDQLNQRLGISKQTLYRRYKNQFGIFDVTVTNDNKDTWEQLDGTK